MRLVNFFILFFFVLTYHNIQGQPSSKIQGRLIDSNTSKPVALAHIRITDTAIGTISNGEGEFALEVPEQYLHHTVTISCIGYQNLTVKIGSLLQHQQIPLTPSAVVLSEVIVSKPQQYEKNPKRIVLKALELLDSNCHTSPMTYRGYYRQIHQYTPLRTVANKGLRIKTRSAANFDSLTYVRLLEAEVDIVDGGFGREESAHVRKLRRSQDHRQYNVDYYEGKGRRFHKAASIPNVDQPDSVIMRETELYKLENYLQNNPIRYRNRKVKNYGKHYITEGNYGYLNGEFAKRHQFKLQEVTYHDDQEVYVVKILPKAKSYKHGKFSKHHWIPLGKLYIRVEDYAIVQMEYSYVINPKKRNYMAFAMKVVDGSPVLYRDLVKYQSYKGKMYLAYMKRWQRDVEANSAKDYKGYYYVSRELMVTEVITDGGRVQKESSPIAHLYASYVYHAKDWEQINTLQLTEGIRKKLKEDLEKEAPLLEEQYISEGSRVIKP